MPDEEDVAQTGPAQESVEALPHGLTPEQVLEAVGPSDAEQRPRERSERLTDVGNARRFVRDHRDDLRYADVWLAWDGARWAEDTTGEHLRKAQQTALSIWDEANRCEDPDFRPKLQAHSMRSESAGKIRCMVELAQHQPEIAVRPDAFDTERMLLNTLSGTLDLETGELLPHDRSRLITKLAPVQYDEGAECVRWLRFLREILDNDPEVIEFAQRFVGYTLTGSIEEQVLAILYGLGANGKSTFLETLRYVLGDYAKAADFTSLAAKRSDGSARNDLARLRGARLVTAIEVGAGRSFDESLIKQLTGTDTISARFLYQEAFEFVPMFKLMIAANHKPVVKGTDDAIWRRLILLPFTVTIPPERRDPMLLEKLREEAPGILAWAVRGCLEWQRNPLRNRPAKVTLATAEYRNEMDVIGAFIADCTVEEPDASVEAGVLYARYRAWAEQVGEEVLNPTAFGRKLTERGRTRVKRGRAAIRMGIRLREDSTTVETVIQKVPLDDSLARDNEKLSQLSQLSSDNGVVGPTDLEKPVQTRLSDREQPVANWEDADDEVRDPPWMTRRPK